jgi:hypothetical protein
VNPASTFLHILADKDESSTSLYIRLDTLPVSGPGPLHPQEVTLNGQRLRVWLSEDPNRSEGA